MIKIRIRKRVIMLLLFVASIFNLGAVATAAAASSRDKNSPSLQRQARRTRRVSVRKQRRPQKEEGSTSVGASDHRAKAQSDGTVFLPLDNPSFRYRPASTAEVVAAKGSYESTPFYLMYCTLLI